MRRKEDKVRSSDAKPIMENLSQENRKGDDLGEGREK